MEAWIVIVAAIYFGLLVWIAKEDFDNDDSSKR